jgi:hypothetical protein
MAQKGFNDRISERLTGEKKDFKGSGVEGNKDSSGDSKNKQTNKETEELKNGGT